MRRRGSGGQIIFLDFHAKFLDEQLKAKTGIVVIMWDKMKVS